MTENNIKNEEIEKLEVKEELQDISEDKRCKDKKCDKHDKKLKKLEEEIERLNIELANNNEKSLRVQAEMINFKRRKEEEMTRLLKYANEDVLASLLPIIDNFERGLKMDDNDLSDEVSKFLTGFKMIYTEIIGVLNKNEVKEIEAEGVEFDPKVHQAVLMEHDQSKPHGVVVEVLQKGYMYKDKVIRPAMVKVNE